MRLKTFRGGVHPPDCKWMTQDKSIRKASLPAFVRIPLEQNAGTAQKPVVKEGQRVRTGEKIAEAEGNISVPMHASISGTVRAIRKVPVPYGGMGMAVEIEGDGRDETAWRKAGASGPAELDRPALIEKIRQAGIVGLGGAEFPTYFKLSPPPGKELEYVVINGAECEPFLTADHRLMVEQPGDVVEGARLLMRAAGVGAAYIGIEADKRDAYDAVVKALRGGGDIRAVLLKVKYPQGAEKQLISAVLGREVPSGGLPADVGAVVVNVGTAVAVREACIDGKPLYERIVTVAGDGVRSPGNWRVRIGVPFKELIEQSGGLTPDTSMLIMGGPMMGIAQWTADVPVVKGTSGIIALRKCGAVSHPRRACIRCGKCLQVCPMGLSPALIRQAAEKGRWDIAEKYGVMECMECGACAYVCSTARDQIQLYKRAKAELRKRSGYAG